QHKRYWAEQYDLERRKTAKLYLKIQAKNVSWPLRKLNHIRVQLLGISPYMYRAGLFKRYHNQQVLLQEIRYQLSHPCAKPELRKEIAHKKSKIVEQLNTPFKKKQPQRLQINKQWIELNPLLCSAKSGQCKPEIHSKGIHCLYYIIDAENIPSLHQMNQLRQKLDQVATIYGVLISKYRYTTKFDKKEVHKYFKSVFGAKYKKTIPLNLHQMYAKELSDFYEIPKLLHKHLMHYTADDLIDHPHARNLVQCFKQLGYKPKLYLARYQRNLERSVLDELLTYFEAFKIEYQYKYGIHLDKMKTFFRTQILEATDTVSKEFTILTYNKIKHFHTALFYSVLETYNKYKDIPELVLYKTIKIRLNILLKDLEDNYCSTFNQLINVHTQTLKHILLKLSSKNRTSEYCELIESIIRDIELLDQIYFGEPYFTSHGLLRRISDLIVDLIIRDKNQIQSKQAIVPEDNLSAQILQIIQKEMLVNLEFILKHLDRYNDKALEVFDTYSKDIEQIDALWDDQV
ncbi:MAG: hypothetical protein ACRC9P_07120, partial [Bacteroides sp.]